MQNYIAWQLKSESRPAANFSLKEGGVEFISIRNEGFDDFPL